MAYLGTKPNVATSLADNIVTADKISDGAVGTNDLSNGAVTAAKIASGAISTNTYTATNKVTKFIYGNAAPNQQPITTSFTLSEAEAPIGSYVILRLWVQSGNSAGQQYCQLYQRSSSPSSPFMAGYITGWYWYESNLGLFYIADAADRTFHISHGTIASTNNNDFREVSYHGYIKVTQ